MVCHDPLERVLAAGHTSVPGAKDALENLCRTYWYPLYAYVRRKGYQVEDAKDLTKQFFARLLQGGRIALADPACGRFRTFLLTALNHFLINEWTRAAARNEGARSSLCRCKPTTRKTSMQPSPLTIVPRKTVYEQRWGGDGDEAGVRPVEGGIWSDRARLFEALKPFVWGEKAGATQAEIAATLG